MKFKPKDFWNPSAFDVYEEYRNKLTPELQLLYDQQVEPECDCDYGSSHCPHMGKSPSQVYNRIYATVVAAAKDMEDMND